MCFLELETSTLQVWYQFVYIVNIEIIRQPIFQSHIYVNHWKSIFSFKTGTDIALLTLADHSILSYGTFGMWGALLANNGEVAMPSGYDTHRINKEINWARTLGLMKNWFYI